MFEEALADMWIVHHRIQIATPWHNGKVERQHRTDEARFYRHMKMYSLEDRAVGSIPKEAKRLYQDMHGEENAKSDRKDILGSSVRRQLRATAGTAAASTLLYHTKSMSRSGSIPFGNFRPTFDIV